MTVSTTKVCTLRKYSRYIGLARGVATTNSIGIFRQLAEIAQLYLGKGRIGLGDYYVYRLFEQEIQRKEKKCFVGWRAESWLDSLNEPQWRCLGLDKVLMYALFRESGIRVPETRAIYLPGRRRVLAGAACLTSASELCAWLRDPGNYPFFSKPSASGFGRDAFFALALDTASDYIEMLDGSKILVDEFIQKVRDIEHLGYLFQTPVRSDERLLASMGATPSSLRLMILLDEDEGPLLHRAFWKIPTGRNMNDNFNSGHTGNLAAAINHETGTVVRVITGVGPELIEVDVHPDSGVKLNELKVPDWQRVKEFTFSAALTLPKLRFQQWDIALSDDGPLALEVNLFATGGCDLTQLLYRKGLLDDDMRRFLGRNAERQIAAGQ